MVKRITALILVLVILLLGSPVAAQTPTPPPGPVYIVQEGDTLWGIAIRFNVTLADLKAANNLSGESIFVGDRLIIPGLEGISGTLITKTVPYGETLRSLARQYRVSEPFLRKLNHLVSPTELYAGYSLILLEQEEKPSWTARTNLTSGDTLLELAVINDTDPWKVAEINSLAGTWDGLPGDALYLPSGPSAGGLTGLPAAFVSAKVDPLPIVQGTTVQIQVLPSQPVTLGGELVDHALHFFPQGDNSFVALQGVNAMTDPGLYPLKIEAVYPDGSMQSFEQMVLVASGNYPHDPTLYVDPGMIDPKVTAPELQQIETITAAATPDKLWQGGFTSPASLYAASTYYTSRFGSRRTYVGVGTDLQIESYHTGLDFGGGVGLPITAPAAGRVVFAGPLTVRGNATIIDHGWGVYSGFWHQSEIKVTVGQMVQEGEVIGLVGGTGRVTGPHLHWEIWVNGVQVNPLEWLQEPFPH